MANNAPRPIATSRLRLLPAGETHLRAALKGNDALASASGCTVPPSWPPQHFDTTAVQYTLDWLKKHPADAPWGFYCIELPAENGGPGTLVGTGGFKGGPDADGIVEIGYSVLPEFQGRGFAIEAVNGWVSFAFSHPKVQMICAHTLASGAPSISVLRKAGFVIAGRGHDSGAPDQEVVRFELARK